MQIAEGVSCSTTYRKTMQIYAATSNSGKLHDFAQSAAAKTQSTAPETHSTAAGGIEILPLPSLAAMPEPIEDAPDFAGNAALKAIAYSRLAPGLLVLADDSGLEVDALDGRPGVRSARFADDLGFEPDAALARLTPFTRDERNNLCLLSLLRSVELAGGGGGRTRRDARFVCELALARDGQVLQRASGSVAGEILDELTGSGGFGYDPLFFLPFLGRSMAQLDPATRWTISHRGRAFRALLEALHHNSGLALRR